MDSRDEWVRTKQDLVSEIKKLGFPESLGNEVAVNLGSPKAMERMIAYLHYVKPRTAELIVDEMLAICSDIDRWKKKKMSEAANAAYNEMLDEGI
ncbi:MAG: hypothetical protein K6E47_04475 [Lachnospiraceae bacterium]|nr:hypothetical protein [Lachnospiraceae bacterium]